MPRHFTSLADALTLGLLAGTPVLAADLTVEIMGMKFAPATIEAKAGDTITFINRDGARHSATATDGSFDTGVLKKGESASITVGAAGKVDFFCTLHRSMKGKVVVK